ncbi:hypothetical protein EVG20_g8126 [Dentipellis fragilis]|uniref:Aminoglycoside phosphotransferase domain-containing protein n=1 Tax=Dentipellis fragilis TaxID=205917 RepID=A0A4Y9Y9T3_9AGAM|nr:hypothetical protein EVG20_g8126 [Dentipellis fragilis]
MASFDLAKKEDVLRYLSSGPFASTEVVPFSGGFGNYTYRLRLRDEYQGRRTAVLKHGKPCLPGATSFAFALYRQNFDQTAMREVRKLLPEDSLATTPEVYLYDEDASVIVMEDCGEDSVTLKDLLKSGPPVSLEIAHRIGAALGTFLARLHAWGKSKENVLNMFEGNKQARTLSAWATYGRLVETLSGASNLPVLDDPPLNISADKLTTIAKIAQETTDAMESAHEAVLMGDFWPGNVLLLLKHSDSGVDVERIFIVDWELVKPGLPGLDIGQFCGEMQQMRHFYPATEPLVQELVSQFLGTYRTTSNGPLVQEAKVALTHIGAHLVAWTVRSGWEGKENTREAALEGVECLLDGYEGKQEKIDASVVGVLTR